jgi:hypothetical protein
MSLLLDSNLRGLTSEQRDEIALGDALAHLRESIALSRGMFPIVTPGLAVARAQTMAAAACPRDRRLLAAELAALALRLTFEQPAMPDELWRPEAAAFAGRAQSGGERQGSSLWRPEAVPAAAGNGGAVPAVSASAASQPSSLIDDSPLRNVVVAPCREVA